MWRNIGPIELLVLLPLLIAIFIVPGWRAVSKTGYPGALSLLGFVPFLNILLLLFLAFSKWPIEREVEQLRIGIR